MECSLEMIEIFGHLIEVYNEVISSHTATLIMPYIEIAHCDALNNFPL